MLRQLYLREKPRYPLEEAGLVPGAVLGKRKFLAVIGIRAPDRLDRSESVYRHAVLAPAFEGSVRSFFVRDSCHILTSHISGLYSVFQKFCTKQLYQFQSLERRLVLFGFAVLAALVW